MNLGSAATIKELRVRAALRTALFPFVVAASAALSSCGGDEGTQTTGEPQPAAPATPASPSPNANNSAPTIEGSPPTATLTGRTYSFRPAAADADGHSLMFTIANRPAWAAFNVWTGRLSGMPSAADVGSFADIRIAVTDGRTSTALPPFSINVVATASGSATLSWAPPTVNSDGSALNDLSGYRVRWGTQRGDYANSVVIDPGLSSYTVDLLTPATWYFVVTAMNAKGIESRSSNSATKAIQ